VLKIIKGREKRGNSINPTHHSYGMGLHGNANFSGFYFWGFTNSSGCHLKYEIMMATVRLLFACIFCISHFTLKLIRGGRTGPSVCLEADQVVFL